MAQSDPLKCRVAVIGLGIAGVTSVKNLVEQGFENVVGYERNDRVGGLWAFNPDSKQTTVLRSTKANGSKHFSAFQDFPFGDDLPDYPTAEQTAEYMDSYVKHFGFQEHLRLNTSVKHLGANPNYDGTSGKWRIKIQDSSGEREEVFDKVLVTNGPWGKAFMPTIPGMEDFKGEILHSQGYKGPEAFEGKRVVVVGMGNTGGDTATSLVGHAKEVYLSHRAGGRLFQRYMGGATKPLDHRITRRRFFTGAWVNRHFPGLSAYAVSKIHQILFKREYPGYKDEWGFFPAPPIQSSTGGVEDGLIKYMIEGKVCNLHGIKRFTSTSIITNTHGDNQKPPSNSSGKEEKEIETSCDAVIFASGYSADFSFCSPEASPYSHPSPEWDSLGERSGNNGYPRLYQTLFSVPHSDSLAFIGPCKGFSPVAFSNCDSSAQAIAQVWKGSFKLPPKEEMDQWCDAMYQRNLAIAREYRNFRVGCEPAAFERWLNVATGNRVNEMLGWTREGWKFWWNERKLYKFIMDGVNTPFVYRLWEGREGSRKRWEGAKRAIYNANGVTLDEGKKTD